MTTNKSIFKLRRAPILLPTLCFICGIALEPLCDIQKLKAHEFILFAVVYLGLINLLIKRRPLLKSICIYIAFILMGLLWAERCDLANNPSHFSKQADATHLLATLEEKVALTQGLRCRMTISSSGNDTTWVDSDGTLLVYLRDLKKDDLTLGSTYLLPARYKEEKKNSNPHVFDYKAYLNNRGIYHRSNLQREEMVLVSNRLPLHKLKLHAQKLRSWCIVQLAEHIDETDLLGVVAAMVLGERNLLPDELYQAFTDSGAVHVLAVSGLHVGIVGGLVVFFFRSIKSNDPKIRFIKCALLLVVIWSFALLTGLAPAVNRAAIMFSLYYIGKLSFSNVNSLNILSAAALAMLIADPRVLWQASFQFSFLALLGIILFYAPMKRTLVLKSKLPNAIWASLCISFSAQLFVSPLAFIYFHKFPMYFWLSSLLAIPLATAILWLGLIFLLFSMVGAPLIIKNIVILGLKLSVFLLNKSIFFIQSLPLVSADDISISAISVVLLYAVLFIGVALLHTKNPRLLIAGLALLLTQSLVHNAENQLRRTRSELVIYDSYRGTVIDLFHEEIAHTFIPQEMDDKSIDFVSKNNRLERRVTIVQNETAFLTQQALPGLVRIKDKLVLIAPDKSAALHASTEEVDLLILNDDSYNNLDRLYNNFCIKKVVVDGTIFYNRSKLQKQARELGIEFHSTSLDGAFILRLS